MPNTTQIADILFKKSLGLGTTQSGRQFFEEPIKGRPFVIPTQIWKDSSLIPDTAPTGTSGIVQKLTDYQLVAVGGTSNAFSGALLVDAIPFNWGDGTSYNYGLKDNTNAAIAFGVNDWVVDTEAGILMFNNGVPSNMPPKISFYRYSGTKGLSSGDLTTGAADLRYYPLLSNPSGYLTGVNLSSYALKNDTGNFVSSTQTGQFAETGNLFLTGRKIDQLSGYVNNTFALKSDTGNFVSKTETGGYANAFNLIQTGSSLDNKINTLSGYSNNAFALKIDTGNFVSQTQTGHLSRVTVSGAYQSSWDLTGINGLQVIASGNRIVFSGGASQTGVQGDFIFRSETGQFSSDSDLLYASGYLVSLISAAAAGVSSIAGLSGVVGLTAAGNVTITTGAGNITISGATGTLATSAHLVATGAGLDNKINSLSGYSSNSYALKSDTGNFVSKTETGGYATAFNLFLTGQKVDQLSGYSNSSFALKADTGNFVSRTETGVYSSLFYPLSGNPSGYVRSNSGSIYSDVIATIADGKLLIGSSGQNALILGDLIGQSGISIISGSGQLAVAINQTLFALAANTGNFVSSTQTGGFANSLDLVQTGANLDNKINTLSGFTTNNFALKSDTGNFVSKTETGVYATTLNLFLTGQKIDQLSGYANSSFALKSDTGNFVSKTETGSYSTVFNLYLTGQKIDILSGYSNDTFARKSDTGNFVSSTQTGHLSRVTVSGVYQSSWDLTGINGLQVIASGNRIVFSGGASQTGVVGDFVFKSETGQFVTQSDLLNASGDLVDLISASSAGVGSLNGLSGVVTLVGTGGTQIFTSGQNIYISGGAGGPVDTGSLTGAFYPLNSNPSGYVRSVSGDIYISNSPQIYDGQLLVGSSGDNAFIQGGLYGSSGIVILTGSGVIGVSVNQSLFILPSQTGVFATTQLVAATGQSLWASIVSLSGNATLDSETGILLNRSETGVFATSQSLAASGQLFYPKNSNPSGYVRENYVKGLTGIWETGNEITHTFSVVPNPLYTGETFETGSFSTFTLNDTVSNQSYAHTQLPNGIVNSIDLTASVVQPSLTLTCMSPLNEDLSMITITTGAGLDISPFLVLVDGRVYGANFFKSGVPVLTGLIAGTGISLVDNLDGSFVVNSTVSTGTFATATDLYNTGQLLYPRSNPSGFITGLNTGNFITTSQTGIFATRTELYNSGQLLYPRSNPSGFVPSSGGNVSIQGGSTILDGQLLIGFSGDQSFTKGDLYGSSGIVILSGSGSLGVSINQSLFALNSQTGSLTGAFYPLNSNPSGYVKSLSGTVDVVGGAIILDGHLLIGSSGDNAFLQGNAYGLSGISIISGSGSLGISINQSLFALAVNTGNFVSQTQTGILLNRSETGIFATAANLYNSGQLLYPRSNPSGFAPTSGGSILIEGGATILNGQLLIGNSGTNSFDQGNLWAGSGISIVSGSGYLIIHATATGGVGGGEINTASNLGAGSGLFAQKSTYDLQFKSLKVGEGLSITGSDIELSINVTGNYILSSQTGILLNRSETGILLNRSETGILLNRSETGIYTGQFYPLATNPSGYVTNVSGLLDVGGTGQIYDGELLIGSSGDNAFVQGRINAGTGIFIQSGAGFLTINSTTSAGSPWTEYELDFGSTPVYDKTFTITGISCTVSSFIVVTPCERGVTGSRGEWLWDNIQFVAEPGTGQFNLYSLAIPGPVAGTRKIQYQVN